MDCTVSVKGVSGTRKGVTQTPLTSEDTLELLFLLPLLTQCWDNGLVSSGLAYAVLGIKLKVLRMPGSNP